MTAKDINQQLQQIYEKYTNSLYQKDWDNNVSAPLLMHVFDEYVSMDKRIMFVGQETHTWDKMVNKPSVDYLQDKFKNFSLGKCADYGDGKRPRYLTSNFWNFNRSFFFTMNKHNPAVSRKTNGFLWTNISKFDYNGKTPSQKLQNSNPEGFSLLRQEIAICRPNIVVLLTGEKYDHHVNSIFDPKSEKIDLSIPLWKVSANNTKLSVLMFKTEHPRTLCQNKKYRDDKMYWKVLEAMEKEASKSHDTN